MSKAKRPCYGCSRGMAMHRGKRTTCSSVCREGLRSERKRQERLKDQGRGGGDPLMVFERDGWVCKMCGCATPRASRGTYEPTAPELDHMVPLSKGGHHTWANVQCACRKCNQMKSDRLDVMPLAA